MQLPRVTSASVWPPVLVTAGPGARSEAHAHHAMHLVLARGGTLAITVGDTTVRAAGIVTAPDHEHALDARGVDIVLVFFDPESDAGERLRAGLDAPVRTLDAGERDGLLADLPGDADPEPLHAWGHAAAERLSRETATPRALHPRVRKLLRALRSAAPEADTSLPALAALAGLSESRLVHAFRDSVGIPLRPYLLWQKLQRAVVAMACGEPLARAAHSAGFADAAHMSRTFRRMFGMTASELQRSLPRPA
ncbi:helix-turn-helix transcriptional regulator [Nannocystis bainbridge]|uniref:Helix-turn-helix domain-containing protein n=1 Tax=Nannocystis bainbridge TaxID=2995303 RepID=A0ABT5DTC4_9BACT|nr:helix-turn-helix domain-containing protein [Nannocystis bainbridge]MDC0716894.1 helix-turn-helix domain-containing protein [Nannocystis bainbridge]